MKALSAAAVLIAGIVCLVLAAGHGDFLHTHRALVALWLSAAGVAAIHTLAGPDHYLPFIAIAKSRGYGLGKTLLWTALCGVGHIGSALLIAAVFSVFAKWLAAENFEWLQENQSDLAAYLLIGIGAAYLLHALRHRWLHRHAEGHEHMHNLRQNGNSITIWVVFIVFILGPCEALFPVLAAATVMGTGAVVSSTLIFSGVTIATMLAAVAAGMLGLRAVHSHALQHYAHEIAGATIAACGIAILCGL